MNYEEAVQEQINEIMDTFDFGKAHRMMAAVNWTWALTDHGVGPAVPTEAALRKEARRLLTRVAFKSSPRYTVSSGGLTIEKTVGDDEDAGDPEARFVRLSLSFGLNSFNDGTTFIP